jgi:hypothetical protein
MSYTQLEEAEKIQSGMHVSISLALDMSFSILAHHNLSHTLPSSKPTSFLKRQVEMTERKEELLALIAESSSS